MPITTQDSSPLFGGDGEGTLKLVAYAVLAITLMVSDQKGHYVAKMRREASAMAGPIYWLASSPARISRAISTGLSDRYRLESDYKRLREQNILLEAKLNRVGALAAQNNRLLQLLGSRERLGLNVQMTRLIDLDLDPYRQRVMVDHGALKGVEVGQVALDAHGVFGQVSEVFAERARIVLVSDPSHQIPIVFERAGLRGIAIGVGDGLHLEVTNLPNAGQVQAGDRVLTSGLGGRFPAGLLIGLVDELSLAEDTGMTNVKIRASARLSQSQELLLVHEVIEALDPLNEAQVEFVGPPTREEHALRPLQVEANINSTLNSSAKPTTTDTPTHASPSTQPNSTADRIQAPASGEAPQ